LLKYGIKLPDNLQAEQMSPGQTAYFWNIGMGEPSDRLTALDYALNGLAFAGHALGRIF